MEKRNVILFKSNVNSEEETPERKFKLVDYRDLEKYVANNIPLAVRNENGEKKFTAISKSTRNQITKKIISGILEGFTLYKLESIVVDEVILDPHSLPSDGQLVNIFNEVLHGVRARFDRVKQVFVLKNRDEVSVFEVKSWTPFKA